ncbi:ABC transporter substrate-binding protein [Actinokineospora iranica]|uniref:Carbohydrate ABC transporter substrate-binding protein, CUT1 family n=1 Tax=Actinokineospora iranica TaxID=1271860 RepID=A0A1G6KKQ8_9PSEU|nr:ABC transporter substrate-binding protein [Actinokineospora iranica]SDC31659.1 carbohydrate ABC transporter substrate-binding protein, CUT1 family [Actinokineospora iranica]
MRSTRCAALALAVTSALGLAACGSGKGDGGGEAALALPGVAEYLAAPCPEVGTKPATDKEFTYWSMWTADEPQGKVLAKAIKCFTEKTGVKVDVQWLGRKLLTQNVAPALNTDTVPDLFDQDISQVKAAVVAPGGTQPVEDVLDYKIGEGDKRVRDVIAPSSYDIPQNKGADGKIFEIPYELLGNAWWYNKDLIKDLQPPRTMDDLFALFDKAKADGMAAVSQDGDINFYNAYFFTQLAARYVGAGGLEKAAQDKTGQAWKADPGPLKAAELVERLAKGGYFIDGWDAAKFPQIQQRWADGDAAFLFVGSWGPSETREYLSKQGGTKGVAYGSFQFPQPEGATHRVVEQLPIGFAVTAKAKHPEAAKAFIAYMLNKDILSGIPAVADNLTPRADLAVPDSLKDVKAALESDAEHAIFMDGLDALAAGKWVDNVFYPLNNDLLKGKITAGQFIDGLAAKQAEFWKTTA